MEVNNNNKRSLQQISPEHIVLNSAKKHTKDSPAIGIDSPANMSHSNFNASTPMSTNPLLSSALPVSAQPTTSLQTGGLPLNALHSGSL